MPRRSSCPSEPARRLRPRASPTPRASHRLVSGRDRLPGGQAPGFRGTFTLRPRPTVGLLRSRAPSSEPTARDVNSIPWRRDRMCPPRSSRDDADLDPQRDGTPRDGACKRYGILLDAQSTAGGEAMFREILAAGLPATALINAMSTIDAAQAQLPPGPPMGSSWAATFGLVLANKVGSEGSFSALDRLLGGRHCRGLNQAQFR